MRARSTPLLAALLLSACTATSPTGSPSPCDRAHVLRARVPELLAAGRLDRTRRVLARAEALCPGAEPQIPEVAELRAAHAGAGGDALVAAGLEASRRGRRADAQRLFDRALVELERETGHAPTVDIPNGFGIDADGEDALELVRWSPRGDELAVVHGRYVSVLDRTSLRERLRLAGDEAPIRDLAWSPDARMIATAGGSSARVWDATSGKLVSRVDDARGMLSVAISSDGALLATGRVSEGPIRLFAMPRLEPRGTLDGDASGTGTLAWSKDDSVLASATTSGIRMWDPKRGTLAHTHASGPRRPGALALSQDGKVVAFVGADAVEVWEPSAGARTRQLVGMEALEVDALALSPDGDTVVTGGGDRSLRLWSRRSGERVRVLEQRGGNLGSATDIAISPDGNAVAALSVDDVRVLDLASGKELAALAGHAPDAAGIAAMPAGRGGLGIALALRDKTVRVWDLARGGSLRTLTTLESEPTAIAVSADGAWVASSSGTTIDLRDARTGASKVTLGSHPKNIVALAFAADGRSLLSASSDGVARRWSMPSGRSLDAIAPGLGPVAAAAFSADGRLVAYACGDKSARVWDISARREIAAFRGHTEGLSTVALSQDGSLLATGSADETIRLASVRDARELAVLRGHSRSVLALAFSPDGTRLASGSMDSTARLWSVPAGAPLGTLEGHREWVAELAWTGAGDALFTGAIDGTVRLWRPDGTFVASLRPIHHADGGYVFSAVGSRTATRIEVFGTAARVFPVCRVGPRSFPLELCEERFSVGGLAARALAGGSDDRSFDEP